MVQYYRVTGEEVCTPYLIPEEEDLILDYVSRIETVRLGDVIVDIKAYASRRWECNRHTCTYNATPGLTGTCCDGGGIVSPYNQTIIQQYLADALPYLSENKQQVLLAEGMATEGVGTQQRYKFREVEGTCIFLAVKEGDRFCALHRVAEDKRIPVFSVKSFDCCLAPLEILRLNSGERFLTVTTEETVKFVRWRDTFPCVEHPSPSALPIYVAARHFLIYIFGPAFYDQLVDAVGANRHQSADV